MPEYDKNNECIEFSSDKMTAKKAIEIITSDSYAGEIVEATQFLLQTEKERDELRERLKVMQHRCVCLTEGHLCKYCVYVDCEYKEQEEQKK